VQHHPPTSFLPSSHSLPHSLTPSLRLLRGGLENFLECADPRAPRLCCIADGTRAAPVKLGSDNPDNRYQSATVDARLVYVVTGRLGSVPYVVRYCSCLCE
jgi:hypothetical protein